MDQNFASLPLYRRINWIPTTFLIGSPIFMATMLPINLYVEGFDWKMIGLFFIACFLTSISITGGYHRLFAHKSYQAHVLLKLFYLIFGAAALQNSALKWCSDHRRHHRNVDTDEDPYAIQRGFFFAHIGWVFLKEDPKYKDKFASDLENDPLVQWQHKYYLPLYLAVGFVLPTMVGWAFGKPFAGFLWGGIARVVVTHHCTFFINSLCHMWGSKPFNLTGTARDNFVLAFFTYGEGYHNFHHKFEGDYRNGIKWYQWDPTKWLIKVLSYFRMTWNLRKISDTEILRAKLAVQSQQLKVRGFYNDQVEALRLKIEETQKNLQRLKSNYAQLKKDYSVAYEQKKLDYGQAYEAMKLEYGQSYQLFLRDVYLKREEMLRQLRTEMDRHREEYRAAMNQWRYQYAMVKSSRSRIEYN
jgi:stearoyl-CoA desaturase (Delta-9 desaturase)